MRRPAFLDVEPEEAAAFIAFMLGWPGGDLPVYVDGRRSFGLSCAALAGPRLWDRARRLEQSWGVDVEAALPSMVSVPCLWAWVASPDSLKGAARFRPAPSLVLRFGGSSERLLLWGLRETLTYGQTLAFNERLSYRLRAPRTRCDPASLRVPLPGTFRHGGRVRPVPVVVTRMELGDYEAARVAGWLKDPPPRDAWRERVSA